MDYDLNPFGNFIHDEDAGTMTIRQRSSDDEARVQPGNSAILMPLMADDAVLLLEGSGETLFGIASSVLAGHEGDLTILGTIEVSEGESLSEAARPARKYRMLLESLDGLIGRQGIGAKKVVKVSRDAWGTVLSMVAEEKSSLLLVPWRGDLDEGHLYGVAADEVLKKAPIDTVIAKMGAGVEIQSILVSLRGLAHAELIIRVAMGIASTFGAGITIMHVLEADAPREDEERERLALTAYMSAKGLREGEYTLITERSAEIEEALRSVATKHDLIIMGTHLSAGNDEKRVGPVVKSVCDTTEATVLIVRSYVAPPAGVFSAGEVRHTEAFTLPSIAVADNVDRWFAENSFHADEFADVKTLVRLKERQGLTISLGLPTLNEEQTIGNIINDIKHELQERYPLVDEIVVIDSSSTDSTVEIARSYGIKVYDDSQVLQRWGSCKGKGAALWKSLYLLKGDIIAWIDTDIKNIHPRFVYGLVGPLIKYPGINYVKGFYRRPVKIDGHFFETGGGRVTELTARPLINLFFPELSGMVQPLSGEYAGRRDVLEKIGFYNGYGVEIGLLIDIHEQFGLDSIAQVDLIERIHRNQSLVSLSTMASAIVQVVMDRLEKGHRLKMFDEINKSMNLIRYDHNQFSLERKPIKEAMKPPMVTLPEYRKLFGK